MKAKLDTLFRRHRTRPEVALGEEVVAAPTELPPIDLQTMARALSVRQPYAEQIMRGTKRVEYRTQPTKIRERVYIYASFTPADEREFRRMKAQPGDFPVGVLVGTVEVADCTGCQGDYEWHLRKPVRLAEPIRPTTKPQPAWFFPFDAPAGQRMLPTVTHRSRAEVVAVCRGRLGFIEVHHVTDRASIADLYPRQDRCGIYVLEFATGEYYVGQAQDVTRRFVPHTKNHNDIERIRFQPVGEERLTEVERRTIAALEREHVPLRNIALTSIPYGESYLDLVLEPAAQGRWLAERSYQDQGGSRAADPDLRRKCVRTFNRLLELPHADELIDVVGE